MLKVYSAELKYSIYPTVNKYDFPIVADPIIVFIGRSNVGKSSVINSLTGKNIAIVSKTPGRTRQINYYYINSKFYFVDLPGYGYANIEKIEIIRWEKLVNSFFQQQANINFGIMVIDIRRDPLEIDKIMINYLHDIGLPFFILLNKIDKLKNLNTEVILKNYEFSLQLGCKGVYLYSATKDIGKKQILKDLLQNIVLP